MEACKDSKDTPDLFYSFWGAWNDALEQVQAGGEYTEFPDALLVEGGERFIKVATEIAIEDDEA